MKIKVSTMKYYKISLLCFVGLGSAIILLAIIFTIRFYDPSFGFFENYAVLFIMIPFAILLMLFPILLNYRQLTRIVINNEKCVSYSLLGKKLCEVDLTENIHRAYFDVNFPYIAPVKFIAISNDTFLCDQKTPPKIHEKKFYGSYNNKAVIIIPYEQVKSIFN